MKYTIEIEEVLRRKVEVEAESEGAAVDAVKAMYDTCEVVLDAEDFVGEAAFRCVEEG